MLEFMKSRVKNESSGLKFYIKFNNMIRRGIKEIIRKNKIYN